VKDRIRRRKISYEPGKACLKWKEARKKYTFFKPRDLNRFLPFHSQGEIKKRSGSFPPSPLKMPWAKIILRTRE
jgi:hypothetical protein